MKIVWILLLSFLLYPVSVSGQNTSSTKLSGNDWWAEANALGTKAAELKQARYKANAQVREAISEKVRRNFRPEGKEMAQLYEEYTRQAEPQFEAIRKKFDAPIATAMNELESFLRAGKEITSAVEAANMAMRPTILYQEKARYTEAARQNRLQGIVLLSIVFTADGRIENIRVIRGLPDGLDDEAIKAAQEIIFLPALKNGLPVSVRMNVEYTFRLL